MEKDNNKNNDEAQNASVLEDKKRNEETTEAVCGEETTVLTSSSTATLSSTVLSSLSSFATVIGGSSAPTSTTPCSSSPSSPGRGYVSSDSDGMNISPTSSPVRKIVQTKQQLHSKLRSYESQRRSKYTSKLESVSLYLQSLIDLLEISLYETQRIRRIVYGVSKANTTYAKELYMATQKINKPVSCYDYFYSMDYSVMQSWVDSTCTASTHLAESGETFENDVVSAIDGFIVSLKEQQHDLQVKAKPILSKLQQIEQQVTEAWSSLYALAKDDDNGIENCPGYCDDDDILKIKLARSNEADDAIDSTSSNSFIANINFNSIGDSIQQQQKQKHKLEATDDIWLAEMQYLATVSLQIHSWESGGHQLSKLFKDTKELECSRRIGLKKNVVTFLESLHGLFWNIQDINIKVLTEWVTKNERQKLLNKNDRISFSYGEEKECEMDTRDTIQQKVESIVQSRMTEAKTEARTEAKTSEETPSTEAKAEAKTEEAPSRPTVAAQDNHQYQQNTEYEIMLESPLQSQFFHEAKILQRNTRKGWKTTLAVITANCFLHLFDLPGQYLDGLRDPLEAFRYLFPEWGGCNVPHNNNNNNNNNKPVDDGLSVNDESAINSYFSSSAKSSNKTTMKKWKNSLVPVFTTTLDSSTIAILSSSATNYPTRILEVIKPPKRRGGSSESSQLLDDHYHSSRHIFFQKKDEDNSKVQLRFRTQQEMQQWFTVLDGYKGRSRVSIVL